MALLLGEPVRPVPCGEGPGANLAHLTAHDPAGVIHTVRQ